jgi:hypothetical protein
VLGEDVQLAVELSELLLWLVDVHLVEEETLLPGDQAGLALLLLGLAASE